MSHISEKGTQVLRQLGGEIAAARRAVANYNELKQLCSELLVVWETSHAGQLLEQSGHDGAWRQMSEALVWISATLEAHKSVEQMEEEPFG